MILKEFVNKHIGSMSRYSFLNLASNLFKCAVCILRRVLYDRYLQVACHSDLAHRFSVIILRIPI